MPKRVSSRRAVKTSMRVGNWASLARASRVARGRKRPPVGRLSLAYMNQRLNSLSRTIETKENQWRTQLNVGLPHNNLTVVLDTNGNPLNPFWMGQGATDNGTGFAAANNRIGDMITVKGISFRFFFENALGRPNVHYKVMLIKMAKGDTLNRSTFYKGNANNKIIDQYDNERFKIVAMKKFTIKASNPTAEFANGVNGQPEADTTLGVYNAGCATRAFTMWVPGRKFGRNGNVQYENSSGTQLKFFDYRLAIMCYDWYGTPQDANNVGKINEGYCKIYFKDA